MHAALFSYVWRSGEQCYGVNGRLSESCSSRSVVAHPVLVQEQLRRWRRSGWLFGRRPRAGSRVLSTGGSVRGTVAVMATSRPRALQQRQGCRHSARRGAVGAGMTA
jgi:hypothetical protein